MFLWPFQASLLWCLRTWLQAVKPPRPVCQGGNCYRKLSWMRTSTSGTSGTPSTDYPAQKVGEIGHLAKGPTRTVCVCVCVYLCMCFPQQPVEILASSVQGVKKPRNWATLMGKHVCIFVLVLFCFCGFFLPLSLNTSKSLKH